MSRALDGVRVLDLTHQVAGPSATLMLAYLGAEVVKVIAPGSRDSYDPVPFYLNNASKKSIELDLKTPGGLDTAKELARRADIFVENFGPGVPGYPVRMSRSPARVTAPPQPGQHTAEVLRDWLGRAQEVPLPAADNQEHATERTGVTPEADR